MANPTLTNYFGATLAGLITANAAAIATDLGMPSGSATDPDKLGATLLVKIRSWLIADGTDTPGLDIENFNNGAYTKGFDSTNRPGQVSYALNFRIWCTDQNGSSPTIGDVI